MPGRSRRALELYEKICTFFWGSSSIVFIKFSLGSMIPKRRSQNKLELWKKAVSLKHQREIALWQLEMYRCKGCHETEE